MREIYKFNPHSRRSARSLAFVCYLGLLLVHNPGARAQTSMRAISTNSPQLRTNGKIAFTSDRDGNREIYLMNNNGTDQVRLTTNPGQDDYPAWSPDGKKIAFLSGNSLKLMNADGTGQTQLTTVAVGGDCAYPYGLSCGLSWSPDGTRIAFTDNGDIVVINIDGSNRVNLTGGSPTFDVHPSWSPDGSRIAFARDDESSPFIFFHIYTMKPDGTNPTLFNGSGSLGNLGNVDPTWSPDGNRIAAVLYRFPVDSSDLLVMNNDGTAYRIDFVIERDHASPAWSPDGRKIAFGSIVNPYVQYLNHEIFVINADGTGITQLTNTPGYESHPSWQPLAPSACSNPIDCAEFFVRQQYLDFLNREPDPVGDAAWQTVLNSCLPADTSCDRIHVSSSFFRSPEFQGRGYFVYRIYSVAFGRKPDYDEFRPDLAKVSGFLTDAELEAAKLNFIAEFMSRPKFATKFNGLDHTSYVDTLLTTANIAHPARDLWIASLSNGTRTRAQVLREISESTEVYNKYYNQAFVVMQYFGYLRRQPDLLYLNWIAHLDATGDYRNMISGFMNSPEYRARFAP